MGITNQQIAGLIQQSIDTFDRRFGQLIESFDQITASGHVDHGDFRKAIMELSTTTRLLQARQDQHNENWKKVWVVLTAALIIPTIAAVVALVFK